MFVQSSGASRRENADVYPLRYLKIESENYLRRPGQAKPEPGTITTNACVALRWGRNPVDR
jgi:hypothetical protein